MLAQIVLRELPKVNLLTVSYHFRHIPNIHSKFADEVLEKEFDKMFSDTNTSLLESQVSWDSPLI